MAGVRDKRPTTGMSGSPPHWLIKTCGLTTVLMFAKVIILVLNSMEIKTAVQKNEIIKSADQCIYHPSLSGGEEACSCKRQ